MRAVVCNEIGLPKNLQVEEREDLVAGPGEVVIDVEACGVNFVDALMVQGLYQVKPAPPFVPGSEVAGSVSQIGEGVTGVSLGANHVIFQQVHVGRRVHRAYVTVHVGSDGRVFLAKNRAMPGKMLPVPFGPGRHRSACQPFSNFVPGKSCAKLS